MADEEHFSLCWNNFNANLSTGFHESLCRGDLVDVTLVAEGQMVRAHRLVLSVCSPLFRDMFNVMPSNQHAYGKLPFFSLSISPFLINHFQFPPAVVLKDVTHTALQDLMTFVYCGEVNIKNEALSTFISTAESLQIKGLTDNDSPKSELTEVMPTQIMLDPSPAPVAPTVTPARTAPQRAIRQKQQITRIEKMESEDSEAEERVPVLTKRQSSAKSTAAAKRMKTTSASTPVVKRAQPIISVKPEPVLIDLPMEHLETAEETVEHEPIETEEPQESLIEEEEQYSEIKYDDTTYFTENEDNKTGMSSYQSAAEVSASDAQGESKKIFTFRLARTRFCFG